VETKIRLFHGSNMEFSVVDLLKSKDKRDFGRGFYTTTIKKQAEEWTVKMLNRYRCRGIYSAAEALNRLRYMQPNDQVSLHTEKALKHLSLLEVEKYAE
jgi:hypothetical protein